MPTIASPFQNICLGHVFILNKSSLKNRGWRTGTNQAGGLSSCLVQIVFGHEDAIREQSACPSSDFGSLLHPKLLPKRQRLVRMLAGPQAPAQCRASYSIQ